MKTIKTATTFTAIGLFLAFGAPAMAQSFDSQNLGGQNFDGQNYNTEEYNKGVDAYANGELSGELSGIDALNLGRLQGLIEDQKNLPNFNQ